MTGGADPVYTCGVCGESYPASRESEHPRHTIRAVPLDDLDLDGLDESLRLLAGLSTATGEAAAQRGSARSTVSTAATSSGYARLGELVDELRRRARERPTGSPGDPPDADRRERAILAVNLAESAVALALSEQRLRVALGSPLPLPGAPTTVLALVVQSLASLRELVDRNGRALLDLPPSG